MPGSFKEKCLSLEEKLTHSAFRRGTSAFRLGLIPTGPSDHLPLIAKIKHQEQANLTLLSWNLLADDHLFNNFMNISGIRLLADILKEHYPEGNSYYNQQENKLFYFFAELAQYLYKNQANNRIHVTKKLLQEFIAIKNQSSNLARSRDPKIAEEKIKQVENARAEIIALFCKALALNFSQAHELQLAIKHSLEMIHHIENPQGALKWVNRLQHIKDNSALIDQLQNSDFLCLQECTKPDDIVCLLKTDEKEFRSITFRVDERTNDHCALIYDNKKFALIGEPIKYALENKKPCIFAKFQDRNTDQCFIMGSIHHPGGKHNLLEDLLKQAASFKQAPDEKINFYILGDYNHTENFFKHPNLIYPAQGTMAGCDFGNINCPIDALLTNHNASAIDLQLAVGLSVSTPAQRLPLVVQFESSEKIAYPRFFQMVDREIEKAFDPELTQSFGTSNATRAPLVTL
jgi:hypothetical protein